MSADTHQPHAVNEHPVAAPAAWSPTGIALITVLFSPLPGGILHALNYARLGRPELRRLTLAVNLLTTTLLFLVAFFADRPLRLLTWAASIMIAAYFYKSQESLFRGHRAAGGPRASLLLPGVLSIVVPVILALALSYGQDSHYERRFDKGLKLMEEGKLTQAEREFRAYQEVNPDDMASYWNLAVIYERSGDVGKAKQELKAFLARNPTSQKAQEYLATLEALNR